MSRKRIIIHGATDAPVVESDSRPQWSRWRHLHDQVDPTDVLQPGSPRYEDGKLPAGFVLLLWDGKALRGPVKFPNDEAASAYLEMQPGVTHFLIVPQP